MAPSEILARTDCRPSMLAFFTMVGTWARCGDGLRAYRALAEVLRCPEAAWSMSEAWPHLQRIEAMTGVTPEVWAMGVVLRHVRDWQSLDWTALILRHCR